MSIAKVRNSHQLWQLGVLALAATWACQPVHAPETSPGSAAEPPPGAVWEGEAEPETALPRHLEPDALLRHLDQRGDQLRVLA